MTVFLIIKIARNPTHEKRFYNLFIPELRQFIIVPYAQKSSVKTHIRLHFT